jgi:hypothetical protein
LFEQLAPLAPAAEPELADELLVSSLLPCSSRNAVDEFSISHDSRVGHPANTGAHY